MDDSLFEVVGLTGVVHAATLQGKLTVGKRLAQVMEKRRARNEKRRLGKLGKERAEKQNISLSVKKTPGDKMPEIIFTSHVYC